MATVTRTSVLLQAQDIAGLQVGVDITPKTLSSTISPTLDLNPRFTNLVKYGTTSVTTSSNLLTTPSQKDFYITFAHITFKKDVTSDLSSCNIQGSVNGATVRLLSFECLAATAENQSINITFPYPIKIDRNTNISLTGSFTAGTATKTAVIGGFILE